MTETMEAVSMKSGKIDSDEVWARILACAGDEFETKTGLKFTYEVHGDIFRSSRAKQNIPKSQFQKAIDLVPLDGPGALNNIIRGPAYVWAVLHDRRIRKQEW